VNVINLKKIVSLCHAVYVLNERYIVSARKDVGVEGPDKYHVHIARRAGFFSGPSLCRLFFDPSDQIVASFTDDATQEDMKTINDMLPGLNSRFAKAE
jgi:hypothetical protein